MFSELADIVLISHYRKVKEANGIGKLVALTRETPKEKKEELSLRTYSNKVIVDANRVSCLDFDDFK